MTSLADAREIINHNIDSLKEAAKEYIASRNYHLEQASLNEDKLQTTERRIANLELSLERLND